MNAVSLTSAVGWTGLFNGFAGKGSPKSEYTQLLPYRQDEAQVKQLSDKTKAILVGLIRGGKLHPSFTALAYQIDDIKQEFG